MIYWDRSTHRNLVVATPPDEEPVDLNTAKAHARVEIADDDALISTLITAAREQCEAYTRRTFVTTSYVLRLDRFPYDGQIRLPKPPAVSVETINYLETAGTDTVWATSNYNVDVGGKLPGVIRPKWGMVFPPHRLDTASVRVAYTGGYGDASAVPACAKQAILLLVGHLYRNREAVSEGAMTEMPLGVKNLLRPLMWGHMA